MWDWGRNDIKNIVLSILYYGYKYEIKRNCDILKIFSLDIGDVIYIDKFICFK